MSQAFDPYHKWLGIPKDEQPPHHYRLLAIRVFEDDPDVIQAAADRQMAHLRTYQTGPNAALSQRLLNQVAAARVCLLKPTQKKAYDARLRQELEAKAAKAPINPTAKGSGVDLGELLEELTVASEAQPALKTRSQSVNLPILIGVGIAGAALAVTLLIWSLVAVDRPDAVVRPVEIAPAEGQSPASPKQQVDTPDRQPAPAASTTAAAPSPSVEPPEKEPMTAEGQPETVRKEPPRSDQPEGSVTPAMNASALPEVSKKWPVPSTTRQEELLRQMDETYKVSLTGKLAEKIKLANNMLDAAGRTKEPDERFALRRKAAELAQAAGDAALMLQAVDRLGAEFDVDLPATREAMLVGFAASAESSTRIESLVESADPVIDQLMSEEAYDRAWNLLNAVYLACQKPEGKAFRKAYHERRQEMQTLLDQWKQIEQAQTTVNAQPDDKSAHTVLGHWYCFVRRDWRKGLPHLAKGDDDATRLLATSELQTPPDEPMDQVKLADAWWDLAQPAPEDAKRAMLLRAQYWYEQAEANVPDGLVKTRVATRMKEIADLVPLAPETPGLLGLVPQHADSAKAYQTRWARHLGFPEVETNAIGMRLVLIPPGEFDMGSRAADVERWIQETQGMNLQGRYSDFLRSESPRHLVRLTRSFYLGMHEVTQAQYQQVMGTNPSQVTARGEASPVDGVSWDNAVEFCRLLSEHPDEKAAGRIYRLPTEAQWEYACRAGSVTPFYFAVDPAHLDQYGWFAGNAKDSSHPVGGRRPNPWGLFDMVGNVSEWCSDWFAVDYYQQSPLENPAGPMSGAGRVIRGGTFRDSWPGSLRSAFRLASPAGGRNDTVGFRVVCTLSKKRAP